MQSNIFQPEGIRYCEVERRVLKSLKMFYEIRVHLLTTRGLDSPGS